MKKAEEYIKVLDFKIEDGGESGQFEIIENVYEFNKQDIIRTIKQVQIDTIEATVKRCAEKATIMNDPYSYCGNTGSEYPPDIVVNQQSILQVAEQLKKELE